MTPFDEMHGDSPDGIRALYGKVKLWLEQTPPETLAARRAQAELFFRRIGITFAVYGEADAAERLIPFDIIPRIISTTCAPGNGPFTCWRTMPAHRPGSPTCWRTGK